MHNQNNKFFFILGMHRSGTSYLAHTLSFLGLELPKSIQPGAEDNPKGHFEPFNISHYHDQLLQSLGLSWDSFVSPTEDWFESNQATEAVYVLSKKIEEEFSGNSPKILKDPRTSLFLPLWQKVIEKNKLEDYYIISLRHPSDVASSLYKRNKICTSRSYLMWINHTLTAEKNTRGKKRSFIHFPDCSYDIEKTIEKIENDLKENFPEKNQRNIDKAKNEFEKKFVHHNNTREKNNDELEKTTLKVYQLLLKLIISPSNKKTLNEIDAIRSKFASSSVSHKELIMDITQKYNTLIEHLKYEFNSKLSASKNEVEKQKIENNNLNKELDSKKQQAEKLKIILVEKINIQKNLSDLKEHSNKIKQSLEKQSNIKDIEIENLKAELNNNKLHAEAEKKQYQQRETYNVKQLDKLKSENSALSMEYSLIFQKYKEEQNSILKPIYRNIYRKSGALLRKSLPSTLVETIKGYVPAPSGVPQKLTFKKRDKKPSSPKLLTLGHPSVYDSPDIFILSIINWDFRYQRPQHIAKHLAKSGKRVFYFEMDLEKNGSQIDKIDNNLYRVRVSSKEIGHIQAYTGVPTVEQTQKWLDEFYSICDHIKSTSFKQVIVQHPFWWQFSKHLPPEFQILFDCMDDIAGFSNTENFLIKLEKDMIKKCDKLIVSSQYLYEKYKSLNTPTIIRNAAELAHFSEPPKETKTPDIFKNILNKPNNDKIRVGYVGAIAEWFDSELVKEIAQQNPKFDIHLCGAATVKEASDLDKMDNITMYGEVNYCDVPWFLNQMDVLIIPFKIIPIIQACDPVKFYEYSAMGKPTVTTALPELQRASHLAYIASSPQEFSNHIYKAYAELNNDEQRRQLQEYAAQNTWQHRTTQFNQILCNFPKVSVIILSYGDPELTKASLNSLYQGGINYPNLEVIIIDNGSPDSSVETIKEFAAHYSCVRIIENGENLGFAKGNNVGLKVASGEYIMLLNNDTVATPGAIAAMVNHLKLNPTIGAVGPLTNNIGNEAKLFVEYENMEEMRNIARQATIGYRGVFTPISVVAYFAVMFRKVDLDTFGVLSEEYGRGMFEDDDHCAIIKSNGFICALAEDAYIHHHLSATFSKLKDGEKEALFEKNKKTFEEKWGKWKPHEYRNNRPPSSLEI